MIEVIPGHLRCYWGTDEEANIDESIAIEVTGFEKDGSVEISFPDRKERVYVKFRAQDLLARIAAVYGEE